MAILVHGVWLFVLLMGVEALVVDSATLANHGDLTMGSREVCAARMGSLEPTLGRSGDGAVFDHDSAEAKRLRDSEIREIRHPLFLALTHPRKSPTVPPPFRPTLGKEARRTCARLFVTNSLSF